MDRRSNRTNTVQVHPGRGTELNRGSTGGLHCRRPLLANKQPEKKLIMRISHEAAMMKKIVLCIFVETFWEILNSVEQLRNVWLARISINEYIIRGLSNQPTWEGVRNRSKGFAEGVTALAVAVFAPLPATLRHPLFFRVTWYSNLGALSMGNANRMLRIFQA